MDEASWCVCHYFVTNLSLRAVEWLAKIRGRLIVRNKWGRTHVSASVQPGRHADRRPNCINMSISRDVTRPWRTGYRCQRDGCMCWDAWGRWPNIGQCGEREWLSIVGLGDGLTYTSSVIRSKSWMMEFNSRVTTSRIHRTHCRRLGIRIAIQGRRKSRGFMGYVPIRKWIIIVITRWKWCSWIIFTSTSKCDSWNR